MRKPLLFAVGVVVAAAAVPRAQQRQPNTEVYLARLSRDVLPLTGGLVLDISNNPGYDNQPSFTPDGKAILYTSNRDGRQTDIFRYDIAAKTTTQPTHSPESEYSPVVTPDGKTFSVIRVESDGTQRLWCFDLDGSNPRRVMTKVTGVGYQAWLDATHVAVFIVGANGQPNTLQLADTSADTAVMIDSNPGHGLAIHPHAASPTVTYVCKTDASHWVVKEFSLADRTPKVLMDAVPGSEDLAWDPAQPARLLMPQGGQLMVSNAGSSWTSFGEFSSAGLTRITRLAVNPDITPTGENRLAFVAEPVQK